MVLMSSIVRIKFWNPDTYAELTSADPSGSGMLLTLWGKETNGTYVVSIPSVDLITNQIDFRDFTDDSR